MEDERLIVRIRELHALRRKVYGSPRIWLDLVLDDGERIGRKRVERLMRKDGLSGLQAKKWKGTTIRAPIATSSREQIVSYAPELALINRLSGLGRSQAKASWES